MMIRNSRIYKKLLGAIEHKLNPLHIYCRLIDLKIPKGSAKKICIRYEYAYKLVFGS